jgi:hypothetical protein
MAAFLYPVYTVFLVLLLGWSFSLYQHSHDVGLFVLVLIIVAITYDNLIVSIGRWVGQGGILLNLSHPRFIGHVLLTPLSIVAAFKLCFQSGVDWALNPASCQSAWIAVGVLVTAEILSYYRKFEPIPAWFQGTLRYTNGAYKIPPIPSILTTIMVSILGWMIWRESGDAWLLGSSIVMFLGGAVPQCVAGPVVCSGAEVVLMTGFCMTAANLQSSIPV